MNGENKNWNKTRLINGLYVSWDLSMHKSLTAMASNIDTTTINILGNALHLMYEYYIYYVQKEWNILLVKVKPVCRARVE